MHRKTVFAGVCVAIALSALLTACSGREHRQIVVIDGGNAEFVTFGRPPKGAQEVWVPGRTLIFRTDSDVPGAPKKAYGKAGHVYRVTEQHELEAVGTFDPKVPNDTLAYRYGS
jgi:hypothetical protein